MIASVLSFVFVCVLALAVGFACFKYGVAVGYKAGYKAHKDDAYRHAAQVREDEALQEYRKAARRAKDHEWWKSLREHDFNTRSLTGW